MDRPRVPDDRRGGEVAERRALENVAVVEKEAVGAFASRLSDQRGGASEADRVVRTITIIFVRIEIGVQIGQADEALAQPGLGACERGFHVVLAASLKRDDGRSGTAGKRAQRPGRSVKEAFADGRPRSAAGIGSRGRS